jgi:hypothetical protein
LGPEVVPGYTKEELIMDKSQLQHSLGELKKIVEKRVAFRNEASYTTDSMSRGLTNMLIQLTCLRNPPPFTEHVGSLPCHNSPPLVPILSQMNPVHN